MNTLTARNNVALWTRESGDRVRGTQLFEKLLPDRERILGSDHPHTLLTRGQIASLTGLTGRPREALHLFTALLPDKQRILGEDHPDTLLTRNDIAYWTAETGDIPRAFDLSTALSLDQARVLGASPPRGIEDSKERCTLDWHARGRARCHSRHVLLLHKHFRVLGKNNPYTMRLRSNLAHWISQNGKVNRACE